MTRVAFLVGFMGCGKSTVGPVLAERLGFSFEDTDALVERRERRSIDRIFREEGEGRFRAVEWEAMQSLDGARRAVVACGGGLFLGHLQRAWLAGHGTTVWLDVGLDRVRERLSHEAGARPLWVPSDPIALRALYERRRATYALARVRVDAGGAPEVVAAAIAAALETVERENRR